MLLGLDPSTSTEVSASDKPFDGAQDSALRQAQDSVQDRREDPGQRRGSDDSVGAIFDLLVLDLDTKTDIKGHVQDANRRQAQSNREFATAYAESVRFQGCGLAL
jgi:hypothetical protein